MGNYVSTKLDDGMEKSIGQISNEVKSVPLDQTPSRPKTKDLPDGQLFDPRSPTVDIERTPITVRVYYQLFYSN